jgi:hypothetical protein
MTNTAPVQTELTGVKMNQLNTRMKLAEYSPTNDKDNEITKRFVKEYNIQSYSKFTVDNYFKATFCKPQLIAMFNSFAKTHNANKNECGWREITFEEHFEEYVQSIFDNHFAKGGYKVIKIQSNLEQDEEKFTLTISEAEVDELTLVKMYLKYYREQTK